MTEDEWLACADPTPMLAFLRGKVSDRKLRFFSVACITDYIRFMAFPHSDTKRLEVGLGVYERYADGSATLEEWQSTRKSFHFPPWKSDDASVEAVYAIETAGGVAGWHGSRHFQRNNEQEELRRLATLLRCITGNPFRPVALSPSWLTPAVSSVARSAYEERFLSSGELDLARLGVLSDALEEAGCDAPDILGHLRSPGPHVRGCWAVDLLLGKE